MKLGIVNIFPPPSAALERLRLAERLGFDTFWTADSNVIWNECYTQLGWLAGQAQPGALRFGPMVTNPVTRDPIVIASALATLQEASGGRVQCGIGRGDSSVRVLRRKPATVAALEDAVKTIKTLTAGAAIEIDGVSVRLPWASERTAVPVYVAAYGPRMLDLAGRVADGVVLECADTQFAAWAVEHVRDAADRVGRALNDFAVIISTATFVSADLERCRAQVRPQGAVVGNHVVEVIRNAGPRAMPQELVEFVSGRSDYDYWKHAQLNAEQAGYVSDEMIDRVCIIGDADACAEKLRELERIGITHVNFYAQTDAYDEQMEIYAGHIRPRLTGSGLPS